MARRMPDPLAGYRNELSRVLADIAGGAYATAQRDIATRLDLVPVIFANGTDDDLPGLVAALGNARVLFDDRILEPNDPLVVERRILRISRRVYVLGPGHDGVGFSDEWLRVYQPPGGRGIDISRSTVRLIARPAR